MSFGAPHPPLGASSARSKGSAGKGKQRELKLSSPEHQQQQSATWLRLKAQVVELEKRTAFEQGVLNQYLAEKRQEVEVHRARHAEVSKALFVLTQEQTKLLADAAHGKAEFEEVLASYLDDQTMIALQEADLAFRKQDTEAVLLLKTKQLEEKEEHVQAKRQELIAKLHAYQALRGEVQTQQHDKGNETEEIKKKTLVLSHALKQAQEAVSSTMCLPLSRTHGARRGSLRAVKVENVAVNMKNKLDATREKVLNYVHAKLIEMQQQEMFALEERDNHEKYIESLRYNNSLRPKYMDMEVVQNEMRNVQSYLGGGRGDEEVDEKAGGAAHVSSNTSSPIVAARQYTRGPDEPPPFPGTLNDGGRNDFVNSLLSLVRQVAAAEGRHEHLLSLRDSLHAHVSRQAVLLVQACRDLDALGLSSAFTDRAPPIPSLRGYCPRNQPQMRFVSFGPTSSTQSVPVTIKAADKRSKEEEGLDKAYGQDLCREGAVAEAESAHALAEMEAALGLSDHAPTSLPVSSSTSSSSTSMLAHAQAGAFRRALQDMFSLEGSVSSHNKWFSQKGDEDDNDDQGQQHWDANASAIALSKLASSVPPKGLDLATLKVRLDMDESIPRKMDTTVAQIVGAL